MSTKSAEMSDGLSLFRQGAEARLYRITHQHRPAIMKERFVKRYRHQDLDARITKERMKAESRALARCQKIGIRAPQLYDVDMQRRRIVMEDLSRAETVHHYIDRHLAADTQPNNNNNKLIQLATRLGKLLARMHNNQLIHGDLTTSNMLLLPSQPQSARDEAEISAPTAERSEDEAEISVPTAERNEDEAEISAPTAERNNDEAEISAPTAERNDDEAEISVPTAERNEDEAEISVPTAERNDDEAEISAPTAERNEDEAEIVLIDFGLSSVSSSAEYMAVDLYVLERAIRSTHGDMEKFLSRLLEAYTQDVTKKDVIKRLGEVRMRGRKRDMVG